MIKVAPIRVAEVEEEAVAEAAEEPAEGEAAAEQEAPGE